MRAFFIWRRESQTSSPPVRQSAPKRFGRQAKRGRRPVGARTRSSARLNPSATRFCTARKAGLPHNGEKVRLRQSADATKTPQQSAAAQQRQGHDQVQLSQAPSIFKAKKEPSTGSLSERYPACKAVARIFRRVASNARHQ